MRILPKGGLELVFDVFGDKEVLDNYQAAREGEIDQRELSKFIDLDRLKTQAEEEGRGQPLPGMETVRHEIQALEAGIVPRLEIAELERALSPPSARPCSATSVPTSSSAAQIAPASGDRARGAGRPCRPSASA